MQVLFGSIAWAVKNCISPDRPHTTYLPCQCVRVGSERLGADCMVFGQSFFSNCERVVVLMTIGRMRARVYVCVCAHFCAKANAQCWSFGHWKSVLKSSLVSTGIIFLFSLTIDSSAFYGLACPGHAPTEAVVGFGPLLSATSLHGSRLQPAIIMHGCISGKDFWEGH
eukprot:scaffold139089_cov17-Tisochrysis_lutea.AAC.1